MIRTVSLLKRSVRDLEVMMRYRVFFVDTPPQEGQSVDLSRLMSVAFDSKDAAMERAFEYIRRGSTVVRITGPDGFLIDQAGVILAMGALSDRRASLAMR